MEREGAARREAMKKIYLYTDGSSLGNPGSAGIAYLIKDEAGTIVKSGRQAIGIATNNQAEYHALLKGLEAALESGAQELEWFSDSQLLVNQWAGAYQIKDPKLRQLMQNAKALARGIKVIPHAVPRNSLPEMELVDTMARQEAMTAAKKRSSAKNYSSAKTHASPKKRSSRKRPRKDS
ncbi:MAG: ribonuclease H [Armatimonadetes bacterium JP3_11]|nr:MAG: ribonuclease H [Armatimonadetes bacterium JP3_11]RMH10521.1 MAG: reverse transcriptase-like protein [Armatimonadota bacterium]